MTTPVHVEHFALPSGGAFTPSVAPTAGHLLVITVANRGVIGSPIAITGWDLVEHLATSASTTMLCRTAQSGDTGWNVVTSQAELCYIEWDDAGELVSAVTQTEAVGDGDPMTCGGPISPGTADPVLVVGTMARMQQNDTDVICDVTPTGGSITLDDWMAEPSLGTSPGRWTGYVFDPSPSGLITVGGDLDYGGNVAMDCDGITAVFAMESGGDPIGEIPPYEPPDVPNAILEIYVTDPDGARWGSALWGEDVWAAAGWVSITPWSIRADVTFGATRAEAGILHTQDPAHWDVETWDPDRVLDPSNEDSIFYPQLVAGLPIRLSAGGRIIRTGRCERIWYSHEGKGGRISATDSISRLANVRVPEDTILSNDGPRTRAQEAIAATGLDVDTGFAMLNGDPTLSDAPSGDFTAWQVIERAARELLAIVYVDKDDRLRWRSWSRPLERGSEVSSPEMIGLHTWTGWEGLYSVVRVLDDATATVIERRVTPTPPYGERVHERTDNTINGEAWTEAVLADRKDAALRFVPGDIRPRNAESVDALAALEIMEDITISYDEADPPVNVAARILGMRVTAVDETREPFEVRTRWRWRLITTLVSLEPLTEDGAPSVFLTSDQDATQFLYPDGVSGL